MLSRLISLFQERVENRYYGKYRGIVESNEDDKKMGRLLVKVPALMGEEVIGWAMPCLPYGGGPNRGFYMIPEKDDGVWVEFEAGNLSYPIWCGVWHARDEAPKGVDDAETAPDLKIIRSKSGHIIQLDDTSGSENITVKEASKGHVITMNQEGIKITDGANSHEILLDGTGIKITEGGKSHEITMDGSGITITDNANSGNEIKMDSQGMTLSDMNGNSISMGAMSGYPAGNGIEINGSKRICLEGLIDWLLSHQHVGNLGIPTPLFPADLLTLQIKTKVPGGGILSDKAKTE